jgi:excisionase family DNA binding protein
MIILTIDEAAQFLRVTKRTLYRRDEIPRIRIGRQIKFVQKDLEAWILCQREGQLPVNLQEQRNTP